MSTRSERIEVFQDTLNWIENDIELSASVIYSKEHTKIYWEDDYPEFDAEKACDTEITVTQDRSYQAAMRLAAMLFMPAAVSPKEPARRKSACAGLQRCTLCCIGGLCVILSTSTTEP